MEARSLAARKVEAVSMSIRCESGFVVRSCYLLQRDSERPLRLCTNSHLPTASRVAPLAEEKRHESRRRSTDNS